MNQLIGRSGLRVRALATSLAALASVMATFPVPAQNAAPEKASPAATTPMATAALAATTPSWTFGANAGPESKAWTAERGTMTVVGSEIRLQPDANRRVVLLSPPALPESMAKAEQFLLRVTGTGLQRVRIQARRDARGGWITIADATGTALLETPDGYVVKRNPGARGAPIERLRIELQFRTTNPRALTRIDTR